MEDFPELPEAAVAASIGATNLAQRMRAERPRDGTTLSMISALTHLGREGPLTAGRLAALQRAKPQTLTRTLARLEERGWIARGPSDTDRRQVLLHLTEQGAARLREDVRSRTAWLAQAMERLSPTEREVLRIAGTLMADLATWDDIEDAR
ncbi:MarR family winged helix-turn-helix transcriptional regulator [Actinoallomurus iriomotensis]|uniref:MarR family transcriptional regulator n=1 Tax=Actinoallomurus iriomotensis TaxID=478107 RepID=A0A9W6RQ05_9ACTN|nr:MarR family transcriptional regulator [Actinoallomurus iriomotensis]GLY78057.1 MarR family transcriptional regulator [Actinoallomurus iriomotensis]